MHRHRPLVSCRLAACVLALTAAHTWAGNLEPPGPPGPTMKTLQEVEPRTPISSLPFTISQPGSYYLTGNLTGASGQFGITIRVSGVTIDLMGFTLQGSPGSVSGIVMEPTNDFFVNEIVIRNGIIRGWGFYGVHDAGDTYFLEGVTLRDLRIEGNLGGGVSVGNGSQIVGCDLRANGGSSAQGRASIRVNGRSSSSGFSVVRNCRIDSQVSGAVGIWVASSFNRIEGNHVHISSGTGILVQGNGNLIVHNSSRGTPAYFIDSGNHVGPITNDPATAGPWANFDLNTAP